MGDDMIATGGTLVKAATALLAAESYAEFVFGELPMRFARRPASVEPMPRATAHAGLEALVGEIRHVRVGALARTRGR